MSGAAHPRSGFTLVEVLVTLLIMAGIMVTVTQILTASRKTRDEIHNIQERQLAGPAILQRLERDLRGLLTYARHPSRALRIRDRVISGYDADTIDFVTTVDGLMPWREAETRPFLRADVNEVGYRLRPRPDSDDFLELFRREDFGVDDEPFQDGRFALLHDRVKGFDIEVYEEDGPEAEPVAGWDEKIGEEFVGIPVRIDVALTIELAPRLVREQLVIDRRTITYRRIIRFPESLRRSLDVQPIPALPLLAPSVPETGATGAGLDGEESSEELEEPTSPFGGPEGQGGGPFDGAGDGGSDENPFGGGGGGGQNPFGG